MLRAMSQPGQKGALAVLTGTPPKGWRPPQPSSTTPPDAAVFVPSTAPFGARSPLPTALATAAATSAATVSRFRKV